MQTGRPVDGARARDDAVGVGTLFDPGLERPMAGEHVELLERSRVEQVLDALAGEHLALVVLALHRALGSAGCSASLRRRSRSSRRSFIEWVAIAARVLAGRAIGSIRRCRPDERATLPAVRELRRVGVFCGSSTGNQQPIHNLARELGATLAQQGIGLVYGGGKVE
jgi:hypothetical protein